MAMMDVDVVVTGGKVVVLRTVCAGRVRVVGGRVTVENSMTGVVVVR